MLFSFRKSLQLDDFGTHIEVISNSIFCKNYWTVHTLPKLLDKTFKFPQINTQEVIINGKGIKGMDTAGAVLLNKIILGIKQYSNVKLVGFLEKNLNLIRLVEEAGLSKQHIPEKPKPLNGLAQLGVETKNKTISFIEGLNFLGQISEVILLIIKKPKILPFKYILSIIDETGVRALPIVGLLSFLIGVVLAYQIALQLETYGANIYVVNLSGMAILREFGPLITAIIVAGRTGSAFTALIGMMHVNEEIDALKTMGISPHIRLIVPRILGLLVALPLLTFWADVFGIIGSMVMANSILEVGYYDFITRLREVIALRTYGIGLSKAPVFACIIAFVGCFQGFQVKKHAESVGQQTTKSVVQAIFLIIIADAIFSVIFQWQGI